MVVPPPEAERGGETAGAGGRKRPTEPFEMVVLWTLEVALLEELDTRSAGELDMQQRES